MSEIYRVRPANQNTFDELTKPYLWFSRPTAFNDTEDASVGTFMNKNESISDALKRLFSDEIDIANESTMIGICCFSRSIPTSYGMRFFPKAGRGIVIVYNKELLKEHFTNTLGLGDCFKKIEYTPDPTIFETSSGNSILWEKKRNLKVFVPVKSIFRDTKETDKLFVRIYTRLNKKYAGQQEERIILAGRNIPDRNKEIQGYQITIPKEAILKIYVHEKCSKAYLEKLRTFGFKVYTIPKPSIKTKLKAKRQ